MASELDWDTFHRRVHSSQPWRAVVVFEAPWCPACKRMRAPLDAFARLVSRHALKDVDGTIDVVRVNADYAYEAIQQAREIDRARFSGSFARAIGAYPTVVFVDTGVPRLSNCALRALPRTANDFVARSYAFFRRDGNRD